MLILNRKPDESIIITIPERSEKREIRVTIVDCIGRVALGIEADKDIVVDRLEIHNRKKSNT